MKLRGGYETADPRLDRVPEFDERSRNFPIRSLLEEMAAPRPPRSFTWRCETWLDQGNEGACVGFAWSHELAARPAVIQATNELARSIYREAQLVDEWSGESYEGTSVLAGAKAVAARGYMKEYRWAFGLADVLLALGYGGPMVIGIPMYTGMMNTDADGFIQATGVVEGHHAILLYLSNLQQRVAAVHNSWGPNWGINGRAKIRFEDLERVLHEQGEAVIPVSRRRPTNAG